MLNTENNACSLRRNKQSHGDSEILNINAHDEKHSHEHIKNSMHYDDPLDHINHATETVHATLDAQYGDKNKLHMNDK